MPNTWREAYAELKDYIDRNPKIEISETVIALPADVRTEFYRLFDAVREKFIQENFPSSLENSYALAKGFTEISNCLKDVLGLASIAPRPGLNWFLVDPMNGLIRVLFDPLFDLLKGRTDQNRFEEVLCRKIGVLIEDYMHDGYKRWVTIALLSLIDPDKNYQVTNADYTAQNEGISESVVREEYVPDAVESRVISFNPTPVELFSLPAVLVHSQRLNKYMSVQADFSAPWGQAKQMSSCQEWQDIANIKQEFGELNLWPDLAVYSGEQTGDLTLVADHWQIARPDMIIEVRAERGWYKPGEAEIIKRHYDVLKPRLGSWVVCRGPVPEEALAALNETPAITPPEGSIDKAPLARIVHLLSVGYNSCLLEPVIQVLETPPQAETKLAL